MNNKIYIVQKVTMQTAYTEPRYWTAARDATEDLLFTTDFDTAMKFVKTLPVYKESDEDEYENIVMEAELNKPVTPETLRMVYISGKGFVR